MTNLAKLLDAGASVIIRPRGSPCMKFIAHKYGVAVEYEGFRNGLMGEDLEEILGRGWEWIKEIRFCSGPQWTAEQIAQMTGRRPPAAVEIARTFPAPSAGMVRLRAAQAEINMRRKAMLDLLSQSRAVPLSVTANGMPPAAEH